MNNGPVDKVKITCKNLDLRAFRNEAAHLLAQFLATESLDQKSPDQRELIVDALIAHFYSLGAFGTKLSRKDFCVLLGSWVARDNSSLDQSPPTNIERPAVFVGRKKEMEALHGHLRPSVKILAPTPVAIHGYGGLGKTLLAFNYATEYLKEYPGGAFRIQANNPSLASELGRLAGLLGIETKQTADEQREEDLAERVKRRLEGAGPALLILDDLNEPQKLGSEEWQKFLPRGHCRLLFTTTHGSIPFQAKMFLLGPLDVGSGIDLLRAFSPEVNSHDNASLAQQLVDWFGGFPVGLVVVGACLAKGKSLVSLADSLANKGLNSSTK